jgi:hypothetical protein
MLRSATHELITRVARPVPPGLARRLQEFEGVLDCSYLPHDSFAVVAHKVYLCISRVA